MLRRRCLPPLLGILIALSFADSRAGATWGGERYRIASREDAAGLLAEAAPAQIARLEQLNRADAARLRRLPALVVPLSWAEDDPADSVLPRRYASAGTSPKFLVVYLPGQLFGAYEFGTLVRWGAVSSGRRDSATTPGLFHLNWRSPGRTSTVDPSWFMRWYFNYGSREGLALHAYALPGYPASHGCIRLLDRDAQWLYEWGESWLVDPRMRLLAPGTPVLLVGEYDFDAPPPWRSIAWLSSEITLPPLTNLSDPYAAGGVYD
jgi:hypothetical protein